MKNTSIFILLYYRSQEYITKDLLFDVNEVSVNQHYYIKNAIFKPFFIFFLIPDYCAFHFP